MTEAPDATTASALAHAQGSRVEVLDQRTETRLVYAEPGGTMTAELAQRPVRVWQGRTWVTPDPTVVRRPDGSVGPRAASTELSFSGGGATEPLVRYGTAGKWLSFSWPGALPVPDLAGTTATYPEALPGVDLVLRAEVDGYAQFLVVKNRGAAPAKVRLGVRSGGLTLRATAGGGLEIRDTTGAVVLSAPVSEMWDSSPVPRRATVGVAVDAGSLTLVPDAAMLADTATAYPVTVDPVFTTTGPSVWAKVFSGKATTNYLNGRNDVDALAKVGQCYRGNPNLCNSIGEAWSYFQFDTRFLAGYHILNESRLAVREVYSPTTGSHVHSLFVADRGIDENTTWSNRPGGGHLDNQWIPCAGRTDCPAFVDIGFAVGVYVNAGGVSTYSLRAMDGGDQDAWRKYEPWATRLTIRYNRPPYLPSGLSTDPPAPTPCKWCAGIPYLNTSGVRLRATLWDPDGDQLRAVWRTHFNLSEEPEIWGSFKDNGQVHDTIIDLGTHENQVFSWELYANDGAHNNGYSYGRGFAVDRTRPGVKPKVRSNRYLDDNRWHGGVGFPDVFEFDPLGVSDVDHFLWGWSDPPTNQVDADRLGGKATALIAPVADGPQTLFVQSVDRAGTPSESTQYRFYVRAGSGPLAQWSFEGNTTDEAFLGDRDGTLNGNAGYAPGAVGMGLKLDGQHYGTNMTAPNAASTDASFSVSAWVYPSPQRSGQVMGAVSQDGTFSSGFYLSYRGDLNRFAAIMVHSGTDVNPPGTFAVAPEIPQLNRWTHLTAVYDRPLNKIRLYVNGVKSVEASLPAGFVPWHAAGSLAVGRQKCGGDKCDPWSGSIDEVKVYDRVLTDADVAAAVGQDNVQVGHWKFDDVDGTTARNAVDGGEMAVLHDGASFTGDGDGDGKADGGAVGGALRLDGVDAYASTSGPAVRTDQSFSVAAWVNLSEAPQDGWTVTALAQEGTNVSGFFVWYRQVGTRGTWEFYAPSANSVSRPADEFVVSTVEAQVNVWTHLAAVFDASKREIRLYVDGQPATTVPRLRGFDATGPLTIGRGRWNGGDTNRWPGLVDEVRAYSRALTLAEIQGIVSRDDVAVGEWKLDGNADGAAPAQRGTLNGGPEWTAGQSAVPDQTDLAVRLNGSTAHVSAPHTVDVSKSFSVVAWARLDRAGGLRTVVSQDGNRVSAFKLRGTPDDRWSFVMFDADVDGGGRRGEVFGGAAQVDVWTHLVASYDAGARQISLYVNGVIAGTAHHHQPWDYPPGGLQIGRAKFNGASVEHFPGAIDDVSVYARVLFAGEIRAAAGRDLTLAHNWTLDESSGLSAGDAVGRRTATLSGGATRVPGRIGNAVQLDGVSGRAATTGVDIRTDASFTVSVWVRLTSSCDPGPAGSCKLVAVSLDGSGGTGTSKFRLGHWADNGQHQEGVWVFEMPVSDTPGARVMKAAVMLEPSDLANWVHLAGVYDKDASQVWLYVNGIRRGDGTLDTPWQATGGLQIGRGKGSTGAPGEFFPGTVDDVRLYSGVLDDDRIENLYRSYVRLDQPAVLPRADAGWWKLDETTGTTAADSSGRGRNATLRGGASWSPGRIGSAVRFDGTTGFAETTGRVLETTRSFSVAAWVNPSMASPNNEAVIAQDGPRVSSFAVQYRGPTGRWAVSIPAAVDSDNPPTVVLTSTQPVAVGFWTHVALTYDATLRQVRLYVNGALSAAQVGVTVLDSAGPFTIGRARWNGANTDQFPGTIDDVRAFGKALSDGEMRAVHDDAPVGLRSFWSFDDGTARDVSGRADHATTSGAVSFPTGISGRAMQLDGVSAHATALFFGVSQRDSFTVSAWANLSRKDRTATVVGQEGNRMSSVLIQYRPNLDRWVFGAAERDADSVPLVAAVSTAPAVQGQWTHLTGVYDYPAHELRLYVNGELAGRRTGVTMWLGDGPFTIGRSKVNGAPADFFSGLVDEVRTEVGVAPDGEIARRAGWPVPPPGQIGRYINAVGDHYTGSSPPRTRRARVA